MLITKTNPDNNLYAAIDIGSNSFHLIVVRRKKLGFTIIFKQKQRVRLAAYLDSNNHLSDEGIKRGLKCLTTFAARLKNVPQHNIRLVATQALRQANNATEFTTRALAIIPKPIEIIPGAEESRLIYFGLATSYPKLKERKLIIDIGGASTEISIGDGTSPIVNDSHQMGCISFTKQFFPDEQVTAESFNAAVNYAKEILAPSLSTYLGLGWRHALGCSGTVKAVREVLRSLEDGGYSITAQNLTALAQRVIRIKHFELLRFKNLSDQRRPVFVGGLAILLAAVTELDIHHLTFSEAALREGVIYELFDNNDRFNGN